MSAFSSALKYWRRCNNMQHHPHSPAWADSYEAEAKVIKETLGENVLDIQHIGSTAIPGIVALPIIDIAVLIPSLDEAEKYIPLLAELGYVYEKELSSVERYYFSKGNPEEYHLSLAQPHGFTYWKRQILFRDFLRKHPHIAKQYEELKLKALANNAATYIHQKGPFIQEVLELAEMSMNVM